MAGVDEFEVGQLAQELFTGYLAYHASREVLTHPAAVHVLATITAENRGPAAVPTARIARADRSEHVYDLTHAARTISNTPAYQSTYDRLWLAGALLTVGDALAVAGYFDRAPDLEFVRHLRNGVAHGNKFHFRTGEPSRRAYFTGPGKTSLPDGTVLDSPPFFEITPPLEGQEVLFGFIGAGDVCDLLLFVGNRLIRIGNGDPPTPLWPQRP